MGYGQPGATTDFTIPYAGAPNVRWSPQWRRSTGFAWWRASGSGRGQTQADRPACRTWQRPLQPLVAAAAICQFRAIFRHPERPL